MNNVKVLSYAVRFLTERSVRFTRDDGLAPKKRRDVTAFILILFYKITIFKKFDALYILYPGRKRV